MPDRRYVLWICTQWCNYKCSYCWQEHERKRVFRGAPAHWADVRRPAEWLDAFLRQFPAPTTVHITGGEALMDAKNMGSLLAGLLSEGWSVSVDTNGTLRPHSWPFDVRKVSLMVTYHPEETTIDAWVDRIESLQTAGWRITSGAYVAHPGRLAELRTARAALKALGLPITVTPVDFSWAGFSAEERAEMSTLIPYPYKGGEPTAGVLCHYPAYSYEMDPDGTIFAGCHRVEGRIGSLFDAALPPLFKGRARCPKKVCGCEDKFQFIESLDLEPGEVPKQTYANTLKELQCVS